MADLTLSASFVSICGLVNGSQPHLGCVAKEESIYLPSMCKVLVRSLLLQQRVGGIWLSSLAAVPSPPRQNAPGDLLTPPLLSLPLWIFELLGGQPEMTGRPTTSHDWKLGLTEADP